MNRCGQCRQFTRTAENQNDLCGAWELPTVAMREACGYFNSIKGRRQSDNEQEKLAITNE